MRETPISDCPLVICVDDDPMNLKILNAHLKQDGYDTHIAPSGEALFFLLEKTKPDLILLDVMMPVLDGYSVCRMLKENEDTRDNRLSFLPQKANPKML